MDEVLTVEFIQSKSNLAPISPRRAKLDRNCHVTFLEPAYHMNGGLVNDQTTSYSLDDDKLDEENHNIPIIKIQRPLSTLSQDNPFVADSELQRKADYILTHSTINRTTVKIVDPDVANGIQDVSIANGIQEDVVVVEDIAVESPQQSAMVEATPHSLPSNDGDTRHVNDVTAPKVAEVHIIRSSVVEPQRAEEVKLIEKGKCCEVM